MKLINRLFFVGFLLVAFGTASAQTQIYTYGVGPTGYTDGTTNSGWQPQNFAYGGRITFPEAGTINQLGAFVQNSNAATQNLKLALYDTSGNLIASSSLALSSLAAMDWYDTATFTPVAVSAADYIILASGDEEGIFYGYDTANDGSFATEAYATFPADPESLTLEGDSGTGYGRRANFTADGGGSSPVPIIIQQH